MKQKGKTVTASESTYRAIMDHGDYITREIRISVEVEEPCSKAAFATRPMDKILVTTVHYGKEE